MECSGRQPAGILQRLQERDSVNMCSDEMRRDVDAPIVARSKLRAFEKTVAPSDTGLPSMAWEGCGDDVEDNVEDDGLTIIGGSPR